MKDEWLAWLSPQEEDPHPRRQREDEPRDRGRAPSGREDCEELRPSILSKLEVARRAKAAAYLARHTTTPGT
jgi:hypothetical protein